MDKIERDFRLTAALAIGVLTCLVLLAFAYYRAWQAQPREAWFDFGIAAWLATAMWLALRSGRTQWMGAALCVLDSIGVVLAFLWNGPVAQHWFYLVLMSNVIIARPLLALSANLATTLAVLMTGILADRMDALSLATAASLISLFGFLLSRKLERDAQRLSLYASTDALTGLPNRRRMEAVLQDAIRDRRGHPVCALVILDVDHFKAINDRHGHAAGDAVLASLGSLLRLQLHGRDMAFRFGGDEFVLLLSLSSEDELPRFLQRIRHAIRVALHGPEGPLTVSCGASLLGSESAWQDWFSQADVALYQAKADGRDGYRIVSERHARRATGGGARNLRPSAARDGGSGVPVGRDPLIH